MTGSPPQRATARDDEVRFAFGRNWQSFVEKALDERRVGSAVESLRRLLCRDDLEGKTFLDIGCGSGLSSLAACLIGADRVISFDYDPDSVQASFVLREKSGISQSKWDIIQGSILDQDFLAGIELADVVYSWGVLHHTGAMWQAIDNAVEKVKPGGLLAIAIYNKIERSLPNSRSWWHIKRAYNHSPAILQHLMESGYAAQFLLRRVAKRRNPLIEIARYGDDNGRGMDFWHDVRDWLGGFPYDYATVAEIFTYLHDRHGLDLLHLEATSGIGCNEFTFLRSRTEAARRAGR